MRRNSILYISFHFIYPAHNPTEQDYLRYTPNGAVKLLEETGFRIIEINFAFRNIINTIIKL